MVRLFIKYFIFIIFYLVINFGFIFLIFISNTYIKYINIDIKENKYNINFKFILYLSLLHQ